MKLDSLKQKALATRISQLNPLIEAVYLPIRVISGNAENTIAGYDLVIDGTDNFATRFLLADACYLAGVSYLHASVYEYQGQVSLFVPGETPCFRCLFRKPPLSSALPPCAEAGVLGAVTGVVGSITATEAIKYITGLGNVIAGKILIYDLTDQQFKKFDIERDENCPLCSKNASVNGVRVSARKQETDAICVRRLEINEQIISVTQAAEMLISDTNGKTFLLDIREEHEYQRGHLDGANLWALSEMQSLPIEVIESGLKKKLTGYKGQDNENNGYRIICYCQRGTRSLKALSILREAGIENLFSLDGGLEAWEAQRVVPIATR